MNKSEPRNFVLDFHGVRYQVKDVSRSITFYTHELGFKLEHQQLPQFAAVSFGKGGLRFRYEMEVGPGGKQIQLLDPDGNPIELFEPAQRRV